MLALAARCSGSASSRPPPLAVSIECRRPAAAIAVLLACVAVRERSRSRRSGALSLRRSRRSLGTGGAAPRPAGTAAALRPGARWPLAAVLVAKLATAVSVGSPPWALRRGARPDGGGRPVALPAAASSSPTPCSSARHGVGCVV